MRLTHYAPRLHHLQQSVRHLRGGRRNANAGRFERGNLCRRRAFSAADNRARVAHAPARRRGRARDKTRDGLLAVRFDPLRGFFFGGTADLADHDDTVRLRVGFE